MLVTSAPAVTEYALGQIDCQAKTISFWHSLTGLRKRGRFNASTRTDGTRVLAQHRKHLDYVVASGAPRIDPSRECRVCSPYDASPGLVRGSGMALPFSVFWHLHNSDKMKPPQSSPTKRR